MDNYSVVSKGEYKHKQTSEHLEIVRFLVVRNKQKRYLLLDFDNKNAEKLTGLRLQIDQYDGRGNYLGVKDIEFKDLRKEKGRFILKERIDVHHACVDFFVKIAYAEYGDYKYCLDKNGTYTVYDRKVARQKVSRASVEKNVGKEGHRADTRRFSSPLFVRILSVLVMLAIIGVSVWQVVSYTKDKDSFFLDNVIYEFVDNGEEEKELMVVGFKGFGGGKLVINDELAGYKVTSIQSQAFKDNLGVKSLTVNGDVIIESGAFSGCENLKTVKLNGVTNIGVQAFSHCKSLKTVEINECEVIGAKAFNDCQSLQDVVIYSKLSDRVLSLGEYAFSDCKEIGNVKIDQFVQMGEYVDYFSGAQSVKSLYLKNYNYAPYEVDEENVNKGLIKLFGISNNVKLGSLTIKYSDTIPDNFTDKVSGSLESVTIENLNTTVVGENAFKGCSNLHTFSVNTTITEVKESAFENTALTSFNAKDLVSLGKNAFSGCSSLSSFNLADNTKLTTIPEGALKGTGSMNLVIPATITSIQASAFEGSKMKTITFATGSQITTMPSKAFNGCIAIKEVILPQTVETINEQAFSGCSSLTAVTLPNSLTSIGSSAFESCSSLSYVDIPHSVTSIGLMAFKNNSSLTNLVIPDSVTSIGANVIEGCQKLQSLVVPFLGNFVGSGASIGHLFGSNYSVPETLTKVKITKDTVVGAYAFADCEFITEFDISNQTQSIGDMAFANCYNLRYFVIPQSANSISSTAFENCYKLFEIENHSPVSIVKGEGIATYALAVYSPTSKKLQSANNKGYKFLLSDGVWYLTDIPKQEELSLPNSTGSVNSYEIPKYFFFRVTAGKVTISSAVKHIGDRAFARTNIKNLVMSSGKVTLGEQVFADNTNLVEINATSSLIDKIPDNTFAYNSALTKVSLPNTVTDIGKSAFEYCYSLVSVNVPQQLKTVGERAFSGCSALLEFDANNAKYFGEIGNYTFEGCSNLKKLVLPNSLYFIGNGVLTNCNSIEQISVPFLGENIDSNERLTYLTDGGTTYLLKYVKLTRSQKISDYAFADWNGLVEVSLPNTVTEIGNYAFYCCYYLEKVNTPISLKTIGNYAFYNCGALKSFDFKNVSTIEAWAFANCASLDNITLPSSLMTMGERAFSGCSGAQTVTIGDGLTDIPYGAFEGCGVKTLRLGSATKNISDYAFTNCSNLQEIVFANRLENIGYGAFMQCNSLKNLQLPASLQTLGEYAFANCYSLETVKIGNGLETISNYAFYNSSVKDLTLGSNVKTVGANAFDACYNLEIVRLNSALRYIEAYAFSSTPIKSLDLPSSLLKVYDSAFAYCSNLEEVTVRSNSVYFDNDAFYESNHIYQVNDVGGLGITRKDVNKGGIAKNAILVNKYTTTPKLQSATIGNIEYKYALNICGIVKINGYQDNLKLGSITINNVTYDNVYVISYATQGASISKLTITDAVKDIYKYAFTNYVSLIVFDNAQLKVNSYAFSGGVGNVIADSKLGGLEDYALGYNYATVYYYGSQTQWENNPNRYSYASGYYPNYYYSKCFHEYGDKWNYDEYGNINTSPQPYKNRNLKEATCTEKGQGEEYCDVCKHLYKYDIDSLGHDYYGYICDRCNAIEPVVVDAYNLTTVNKNLLTFTKGEGSVQMFAMTDNRAVKFVNVEENTKHTFTVEAKVDLTLTFNCDFSKTGIGTLTITKDNEESTVLENDKTNITYTLKAGQKITFEFASNDSSATSTYVKLNQFSIK